MAVTPVGGNVNATASNVTTISVAYSPTAGNEVVVFFGTGIVSGVAVKDNLGNSLTAGPTVSSGGVIQTYCFYGTAASGVTSYVATWTTATVATLAVEEYSGVGSVNAALSGNTATGTTSPGSISQTVSANSFMVAFFDTRSSAPTLGTGTQRQRQVTTAPMSILIDNNSVGGGSISCTCTFTAVTWAAVAIELLPPTAKTFTNVWIFGL